jgi:poly(3-hydroxybutyrate) depolymerase
MSNRAARYQRGWQLVALAACTLSIARFAVGAPALEEVAAGVVIDVGQISVSGISSGGFMAHQFHVAHSDRVMGAGIVAGGPYYCARGTVLDAVTRCSQFVMLECTALGLDAKWCQKTELAPRGRDQVARTARASFEEARKQEAVGNISSLVSLKRDRVYLIRGAYDSIVPRGVMDTVFHFYADPDKGGLDAQAVHYNKTFPARHTMVRDSFDKPAGSVIGACGLPPAPPPPIQSDTFLDDCEQVAKERQQRNQCICPPTSAPQAPTAPSCPPPNRRQLCADLRDVDLAGAILRHLYGDAALSAGRLAVQESEVQAFDQRQVFAKLSETPYTALQNASMAREGYVFIPETCKQGRPCKLHVAFHGCLQGGNTDMRAGHSGNLFAKYAGYNEWAKANGIVVLYPQIQARSASVPLNPQGCWDWWGQNYTHAGYHTKRGAQIKSVAQMINVLAGQPLLEIPAE